MTTPASAPWEKYAAEPAPWEKYAQTAPPAQTEAAAQQQRRMVTPIEGESFEDTMKRAIAMGKTVTPEEIAAETHANIKKIPSVLGAAILGGPALMGGMAVAPTAAGEAAGGGILGGAAAGATGGAASSALLSLAKAGVGQTNPLTAENAKDFLTSTLFGAATGGALGLFEKVAGSLLTSKLARGAINQSVGATTRDVTYGNPAVGILKAGVTSPLTGDLEAYKAALRAGAQPDQALIAAGGKVGQVAQKIQRLAPQLERQLASSQVPIKVADIIDKPLEKAANEIIGNRAMTAAEKDAAVSQLGALQTSLKEGLGGSVTPLEANQIKQAIGNRVNWAGNVAVTDEVKPAYRAVYGAIKNAVNKAVPEAAGINEDLTNLLSAQTDLQKQMQAEEAGAGKGALGSAATGIARRAEAMIGRFLPAAKTATQAAVPNIPVTSSGATIGEQLLSKGKGIPQAQPNQPGVPFHPNQGVQ